MYCVYLSIVILLILIRGFGIGHWAVDIGMQQLLSMAYGLWPMGYNNLLIYEVEVGSITKKY